MAIEDFNMYTTIDYNSRTVSATMTLSNCHTGAYIYKENRKECDIAKLKQLGYHSLAYPEYSYIDDLRVTLNT